MLAAYGVDTLDAGVTPRRVWVLANRLPPHARRLGEQWSTEAELLAVLVDTVAALTWVTMRAHGAKSVRRPRPIPRPPARPRRPVAAATGPPAGEPGAGGWAAFADALTGTAGVRVHGGDK